MIYKWIGEKYISDDCTGYFVSFAHHDEQHERQRHCLDYSHWQENSSETWKWKLRTDLNTQLQYYGLMFFCSKRVDYCHSHVLTTGSRCRLYHGTPGGLHRWRLSTPTSIFRMCVPTTSISVNRLILNRPSKLDHCELQCENPLQSLKFKHWLKVAVGTKKISINPIEFAIQDM